MAQTTILAKPPYQKRTMLPQYNAGWFATELGNVQRAIPTTHSRTATANDTPTVNDSLVLYDASRGPITVTLRPPNQVHDLRLILKKIDMVNTVTIVGPIDGVSSYALTTQYQSITIQSDGHQWYVIATT